MSKKQPVKHKIDPAFNKFIKLYLENLRLMQLPGNEGYLALELDEKDYRKMELEGFPGIAPLYENDTVKDVIFEAGLLFGQNISKHDFTEIGKKSKKAGGFCEFFSSIFEEVANYQEMNQESKSYYLNSFAPLCSEKTLKEHTSNMDEKNLKKWGRKIHSDILSLVWHDLEIRIEKMKKDINKSRDIIKNKLNIYQKRMIRRSLFSTWNTISLLVNRKSLKQLFTEAKNGNEESLFRLIKVDKTLLDHGWVRTRIRKAVYSGDWGFFKELSEAINTDPLENRKIHGDIFLVLLQFWKVGLYRLSAKKIRDRFEACGIFFSPDYRDKSFEKFIKREVKPIFIDW